MIDGSVLWLVIMTAVLEHVRLIFVWLNDFVINTIMCSVSKIDISIPGVV